MQVTIRCILDVEEDVIRDISIAGNASLEDLHHAILESFKLNLGEMAAFYQSNDSWEQGEEIPLVDMSEHQDSTLMSHLKIADTLSDEKAKFIYIYDFMNLWTFYIMVRDIKEVEATPTKTLFEIGEMPKKAADKQFESDTLPEDEFDDDFDDFDFFDENSSDFML